MVLPPHTQHLHKNSRGWNSLFSKPSNFHTLREKEQHIFAMEYPWWKRATFWFYKPLNSQNWKTEHLKKNNWPSTCFLSVWNLKFSGFQGKGYKSLDGVYKSVRTATDLQRLIPLKKIIALGCGLWHYTLLQGPSPSLNPSFPRLYL